MSALNVDVSLRIIVCGFFKRLCAMPQADEQVVVQVGIPGSAD